MNEYLEDYSEEDLKRLRERFENMISNQESAFFDAEEYLALIENYADHFEFEKMEIATQRASEFYPNNTEIMLHRAQLYAQQEQAEQALQMLNRLEHLEPNNVDVYLLKASVLSNINEHEKSIEAYQEAIQLEAMEENNNDKDDSLLVLISNEYEKMGDYHKAIDSLKKALDLNGVLPPFNAEYLLLEIGRIYDLIKEFEAGIEYMKAFIDQYPYSEAGWLGLGLLQRSAERYDEAIESFEYVTAIDDENNMGLVQKAVTLCKKKDYKQGILIFQEILKKDPDDVDTLFNIALCLEASHNFEEAIGYFQKVLELDSSIIKAWTILAWCYVEIKNPAWARYTLDQALQIYPDQPEICYTYGDLESHILNFQEALKWYGKALDEDPDNPEYIYAYAVHLVEIEDYQNALDFIEGELRRMPKEPTLYATAAVVYFKMNKFQDAVNMYLEALDDDPNIKEFMEDACPEFLLNDGIRRIISETLNL